MSLFGRAGVVFGVCVAAAATAPTPVLAADWPSVKSLSNTPQCATPGRLMAQVKARNAALDKRFDTIATEYQRQGEAMGLRWDYAFFQMLVETNDLSFKTGVRGAAVRPEQNNFGGIASQGGSVPGESFGTIADGVRAHLEHLTTYAGLTVEDALAERTRKFQTWDGFKKIQANLNGRAATFGDVLAEWAPKSKDYADGLKARASQFMSEFCKKADPRPDLLSGVKASPTEKPAKVASEAKPEAPQVDLAKQAVATGKVEENNVRTNLGAGLAKAKAQPPEVKIINEPPASQPAAPDKLPPQKTAAAGAAAAGAAAPNARAEQSKPASGKCRVWTASYGNDRALIIKAPGADGATNYTVLDVNKGQETREADAYIQAYAKGGKIEGQFASQNEALDKAFELCPEG